jgi:hypothetical protein
MPIPDLESVLGTRTKIRLLRALVAHTEPVSGREAQRLADTPSSSASGAALDELVDAGLLLRVEAGRAHLYRANRDHLFWEPSPDSSRWRAAATPRPPGSWTKSWTRRTARRPSP